MKLRSVNVGQPQDIDYKGKIITTGIYKSPVTGRVMLRQHNLEGDRQADLTVHGGPDKAVYVYSYDHYPYWQRELGRDDLAYGEFGENFTVDGLTEDEVFIGDVFRIGGALVEVTQPRAPCYKLAAKMNLPTFVKTFTQAQRTGFYLAVLEEGEVGASDMIERVKTGLEQMSVREIFHLVYTDKDNIVQAERAIRIPALAPSWRDAIAKTITED